jgi:RNA polymerase sigma-70 factor, ECF subfamily
LRDPDEVLAARAAHGDRRALEALLERHADRVHALCRRVIGHPEDALDATQEAMISIARGIGRFDGRSAFTTWLYRVATNAALDELRRSRRRPEPLDAIDVGRAAPESVDVDVAHRVDVDAALRTLPAGFRVAVVLRDLCDLDYAQIAEVLGVPPGTVRARHCSLSCAKSRAPTSCPPARSSRWERRGSGPGTRSSCRPSSPTAPRRSMPSSTIRARFVRSVSRLLIIDRALRAGIPGSLTLARVRSGYARAPPPTRGRSMADWTTDAVDALEQAVGRVREQTVVPAQRASRAVVYGVLVAFFVLVAVLMLAVALFRILVVLTGEVWLSYLILGGIFVVGGVFCWSLRNRAPKDSNA